MGRASGAAVTVAVLHAHPAAAKVKDGTGMHPLHYAFFGEGSKNSDRSHLQAGTKMQWSTSTAEQWSHLEQQNNIYIQRQDNAHS